MKKLAIGKILLLAVLGLALLAAGGGAKGAKLKLSDAYLSGFSEGYTKGGATLDSVQDLQKKGVGFAVSGLGKVMIEDNFPVDAASGCDPHSVYGFTSSDCSDFSKLTLDYKNLGTDPVYVNLNVNTGFTDGGEVKCSVTGEACDTFWQGSWTEVRPGKHKKVTLDFADATPLGCTGNDDSVPSCTDGVNQAIHWLDEVSNIGFQVADFSDGGPISTWLEVKGH